MLPKRISLIATSILFLATSLMMTSWYARKIDPAVVSYMSIPTALRAILDFSVLGKPLATPDPTHFLVSLAALSNDEITLETVPSVAGSLPSATGYGLGANKTSNSANLVKPNSHLPTTLPLASPLTSVVSSPIALGWTLGVTPATLPTLLAQSPGLTVLAPKWLHVSGPYGAVSGTINEQVVQMCHARGIKVWAVVDNGFSASETHAYLSYADRQTALIHHLVTLAKQYHLDGLNLDFEGLANADRFNYTHFVQQLATALRPHHVALSVDLPPDIIYGQNTGPYNHAALAKVVSKIVLMGYDQHWGGDPYAGPTASLPWVSTGIKDMLITGVPSQKLVLGMPLYTQDWTLSKQGTVLNSQPLSLQQLQNLVSQVHAVPHWDAALGVHVLRYVVQGTIHEIWMEDERSLMLLADLIPKDHLAGGAVWYLGLSSPTLWQSLVNTLHTAIG
ncbi:glycosyl hydrolase family 18 protein [Ferroacidibacillus organovorans]|uniref:GH18 domain-containing protein n=1 Tax=Ferroacidibacillus organovorans TaxID=1765683 RepID=A0A162SZW5_9BACL|nr:glycosyl hydrolase family 18 protein [Ferroacidibacillus organovorans]KYP80313.1 hypothetical protein AYJ22_11780 [Ferroacidibacillus organovorans]OAG86760.1 hypothetical protein AYW79_14850 [Ferroacidibacillus organovorans]OPG15532.1 hypothetical protein B2M26_10670 [Ferroacidibacillus organovorans]